jgi:hypothetical protein
MLMCHKSYLRSVRAFRSASISKMHFFIRFSWASCALSMSLATLHLLEETFSAERRTKGASGEDRPECLAERTW